MDKNKNKRILCIILGSSSIRNIIKFLFDWSMTFSIEREALARIVGKYETRTFA